MSRWKLEIATGRKVVLMFALCISVWLPHEARSEQSATLNWVGEILIDGKSTFVRVGPQMLGGPEPFLHRPNELLFNQALRNLSVNSSAISFEAIGDAVVPAMEFSGTFGEGHYSGVVTSEDRTGSFILYPTVPVPPNDVLDKYSGTYELAEGKYRTVAFEDMAGMIETRLFYSDSEGFVLLFPLSATEFMTGLGEIIRFETELGVVVRMTISGRNGDSTALKVNLFSEIDVTYTSMAADIAGTLVLPNSPGPHPAVIIAHSSAAGERHAYLQYASLFAQDGLAVLIYDRRGHGLSTGGGPFNLNTEVLAKDMKSGFKFLQARPDIDPTKIGLMGFSNGSWVAPMAARDLPEVAFISVSMASSISQVEAEMFRRESVLRATGVSEGSIAQALVALELYFRGAVFSFSDEEIAEFAVLYQALTKNEELQEAQGINILPTATPLDEILRDSGSASFMAFSPADVYMQTDVPVSYFVGELDENIPTSLTVPIMGDIVARRPDADITFTVYPDALHGMFVLSAPVTGISQDVLYPNLASYRFAPGYIGQMRSWLKQKSGLVDGGE